jgi:hypothetical protein
VLAVGALPTVSARNEIVQDFEELLNVAPGTDRHHSGSQNRDAAGSLLAPSSFPVPADLQEHSSMTAVEQPTAEVAPGSIVVARDCRWLAILVEQSPSDRHYAAEQK